MRLAEKLDWKGLSPMEPEDHLNRIAEIQLRQHHTANRLMSFMDNKGKGKGHLCTGTEAL
jgi:hypothetical protein